MNYTHYIGIDVSKETLDLALLQGSNLKQAKIEHTPKAIKMLLLDWDLPLESTLFCLEPTGHYSNVIALALIELEALVWLANPLDIIKSIGMQRGKNDEIDALRIAEYAMRFKDKARLLKGGMKNKRLKELISQRELLVEDKAKYSGQLSDMVKSPDKGRYTFLKQINEPLIKELDKGIKKLEKQIDDFINNDKELKEQYELALTVPGIGKVLAYTLIAYTNGFESFDNPRALACHAGIVPFEYSSGKSVKSRKRVSHRANKRLKSLLHMAALSVIRGKSELRAYYDKKVAEGKSKMIVLNMIRNKIIHRLFAVINRKSAYKPLTLS